MILRRTSQLTVVLPQRHHGHATTRLLASSEDEMVESLLTRLAERERNSQVQVVEEDDVGVPEDSFEMSVPSFLSGVLAAGLFVTVGGVAYGRKMMIERKAADELELASIAAAAQHEADRLTMEAKVATEELEQLRGSVVTPVPQISTAYALLAWLRQRRNSPKLDEMQLIVEEKASQALEATQVAEKTAQLTSLDLDVVDDMDLAETNFDIAERNIQDIKNHIRSAHPDEDLAAELQRAEADLVLAKADLDRARSAALDVARLVVESKEAILAQVQGDLQQQPGGGDFFDQLSLLVSSFSDSLSPVTGASSADNGNNDVASPEQQQDLVVPRAAR